MPDVRGQIDEFFYGPFSTVLDPAELMTSVEVPARALRGERVHP